MGLLDKIQTIPLWKKVYQAVSGYSCSVTPDIVKDVIAMSGEDLKGGYAIYEPYNEKEFQAWEKSQTEENIELMQFFKRLCKCLNLTATVALPVFFNYLMFEYYGRLEDIQNLIIYDHSVLVLLEDVWNFYSSERMYYIKTLREIFECAVKPDHPFAKIYTDYINGFDMVEFRKTFISQFDALIKEINEDSLMNSFNKRSYVNRNNCEQLEFLLLIIMTMEYKEISTDEFSSLFNCFLQHNFTRQPVYFDASLYSDPKDYDKVKNIEVGFFIVAMHQIVEKILTLPKSVEESLKHIQNQGDHKIVLFSWVLTKVKALDQKDTEAINGCEYLVTVLMNEQVLTSLANFLKSDLMQTNIRSVKLIQAAVFKLLDEFLISLNRKDVILSNNGLYQALVTLLKDPEIASECTLARGGLDVIVQMVFENFPDNFVKLTNICKVLIKHAPLKITIISKLTNLRVSNFQYKTIHYFEYLARITRELEDIDSILLGYELINEIIGQYKGDLSKYGITECINILDQFVNTYENHKYYSSFVGIYFKIHTSQVIYRNSKIKNEFATLRRGRQFLPKLLTRETIPEVLMQCNISNSILIRILEKEELECSHEAVKTYFRLLVYCINQNLEYETIQIPGVIYMARFVFPNHKNWQYANAADEVRISLLCLKIMLGVLNNASENDGVLKKFLFYALLKKPPMMNIFLQYFMQEKFHLQRVMLNEVDWLHGEKLGIINLSKLHFSIFLRLLSDCELKSTDELFENKIQTVAKCALAFMRNAFSSSLANLACRLLEVLSRDSSLPILAILEMDHNQIECLFLEKLRDPLEDDVFKITVLDFINTSLLFQYGLTAAFFNALDVFGKKESRVVNNDSVCDFMIDYLQNIHKSPDFVTNPIQRSILRVFATLWSTGRENLVKDIYDLQCFWPLLTEPLFHPKMRDPEVYTHILTMATIHIMEFRDDTHNNLKKVIEDFFKNEKLIEEWFIYIESVLCSNMGSHMDEWYKEVTNFICAWKKFLMSIKTYAPETITSDKVKCSLILSCLKGILCHTPIQNDNQIITDFSDLYLILIFSWTDSYKSEIKTLEYLTSVLFIFVTKCQGLSYHNREVILTLTYKTIENCSDMLSTNPYLLCNLLKPFGMLFDIEYKNLCEKKEIVNGRMNSAVTWLLVSRVVDAVLSLSNVKQYSLFFKYHQYLNRMVDSIRILMWDPRTLPMVKMILKNLVLYAKSDLAMDFLTDSFPTIYDIVDNGTHIIPKISSGEFLIQLREKWILYSMVIKLNHIILNKFGKKRLESNINFISFHDRIIPQMISLPEYTVDNRAMDLCYETLLYLHKLLEWQKIWSIKNKDCFNSIIRFISRVLNSCITTILRPEHIQFNKINKLGKLDPSSEKPVHLLPNVINRYLDLSCLALKCLIKYNSSMVELFSVEKPKSLPFILVEYDFTIPKFDIPITERLTYGRLLCLIYFLCKTLNQEYSQSNADPSVSATRKINFERNTEKNLGELFGKITLYDEEYLGLIEYPKGTDNVLQPTKLNAFLHYAEQGNSEPWLKDVCRPKVQMALEHLMTFVAIQAFYQINTLRKPQLHYFKRELYSELQFFNEFAKKLATDEFNKLLLKRTSDPQNIDVINRVASVLFANKKLDEISDRFFLLAISKWFQNVCQLS